MSTRSRIPLTCVEKKSIHWKKLSPRETSFNIEHGQAPGGSADLVFDSEYYLWGKSMTKEQGLTEANKDFKPIQSPEVMDPWMDLVWSNLWGGPDFERV